ncbi:hypothetical protein [Paraburkholderia rhizosphaerae]|uniref:Uncharacterized protein n=1 Tax=Paraburkholderia rhizosphaerae TaxID=480658 RepID=A0A4R8LQ97_9BURK|nr:hypothetical protein [Paraburkholderia rhizosphaerae]TDY47683.1 hypothetical protein BX592_11270 [Paraburkholderia rhizosphaerae]
MTTFMQNFSFINGDVIYGDREDRPAYKNKAREEFDKGVPGSEFLGLTFDDLWVTIDQYNNKTFLAYDQRAQIFETIRKVKADLTRRRAQAYATALFQKPNSFQRDALSEEQRKALTYKESGSPIKDPKDAERFDENLFQLRIIRRSCKFGVLNLAEALGTPAKIHFVLDSLTGERLRAIVDKDTYKSGDGAFRGSGASVPVTASELRAVFRAQNTLRTKVHFYRKFVEVPAPWVEDPELWRRYAEARYRKYLDHLKQVAAMTPESVKPLGEIMDRAAVHASTQNFMEAADILKQARALGAALWTPLPDDADF